MNYLSNRIMIRISKSFFVLFPSCVQITPSVLHVAVHSIFGTFFLKKIYQIQHFRPFILFCNRRHVLTPILYRIIAYSTVMRSTHCSISNRTRFTAALQPQTEYWRDVTEPRPGRIFSVIMHRCFNCFMRRCVKTARFS